MAAIIITVVLMTVITLITVGFSLTVRREQRNTLDHPLATQAFYAAESGISLAQKRISTMGTAPKKDGCAYNSNTNNYGLAVTDYDIGNGASITCLLVEPNVPTLEYQNVGTGSIPTLVRSGSSAVTSIKISWNESGSADLTGCAGASVPSPAFGPAGPASGCAQPILRVDLVPLGATGASLSRATLQTGQITTFLYPGAGAGSASPTGLQNILIANCGAGNTPKLCNMSITGLNSQSYGVRVMSLYGTSDITITAFNGATQLSLIDQQVIVDVTAKAQDVLKRVQARTSITGKAPDFALVGDICKRYAISAGQVLDPTATYPACAIP